ncbi:AAA family ATPase [Aurantimonas sp. C2-6-R+9]|uniref:AAA family ATPase n=1 Tax=unclassified Aurantimonas TaxID=2638230 RepID=UPI002E178C70|nr:MULTISPECIES: AAA family ATPase [unclassified Aurantimonas]MEC5290729.1 AAA family ATPase [Aurantimonas sp. C2-3-R2]MEC5324555.1 AAA family ATPase [Aurantimonas sp. A3-2-R12]MEC5380745.1 AAA family ATPase [Aurantimonas sp. C2-6-R+9]MEC5411794.1 AAA family ATPase [Aurantimonas sp. C2-4-R8]
MYLKSLQLTDFAGVGSVDLPRFEPGLNVVVGDNEAGKSTLLTALRAAFFQKHRAGGEAVKMLAPYNRQARPEVAVEFDIDGTAYTLRKAFVQRPSADLSWPGGSLSGDAVEERLAELFRFSHPGRGDSKLSEHQGAFGLLWVEQGRSTGGLDIGVGKDAVTASLEGEVGQILGGERGRSLVAATKALQDRFFTDTLRVASASPIRQAEERREALRTELQAKLALRADYDEKLDRLRRRRETLLSYERDDAVAKAEAAVEAAEAASRAAESLDRERGEAERELRHALAKRDGAAEILRQRDKLIETRGRATQAAEAIAASLDAFRARAVEERSEVARLEARRAEAKAAADQAEAADEAIQLRAELSRKQDELAKARQRIEAARGIEEELAELRRAASGAGLDQKALAAIEAAEQSRREAAIRLSVAAPKLRFEPSAGQAVRDAAGEAVATEGSVDITGRSVFDLEGFGRIVIEPGADAGAVARDAATAEAACAGLFSRHGVASLEEARRRVQAAEERRIAADTLKARLGAILPEGLSEAAAALELREGEIAERSATMGAPTEENETKADPSDSRAARRTARALLEAADAELDGMRRRAAESSAQLATAEGEAGFRQAEAERLRREHLEAEAKRSRAALAEDLAAAEVERTAKAVVLDQRQRELAGVDPETVALTLQSKRRALVEIRRQVVALREEAAALEGELGGHGLTALGEDIDRIEGEVTVLERRLGRLNVEAEASKLLHSTLLAAQREAREHWLGPIKTQVAPYLRLIHPGTEIELDETTLEIRGLHRAGVEEHFQRLSAGAREQVAVVTRIALAQVLKKGGHPATVILDDALVNTDEKRLERMHLVLQKAAEDLQIIVLTCRERDFRGLGAPLFRI